MEEAPAFVVEDLQNVNGFPCGFSLKSKGSKTTTVIGDKTYVIDGTSESIGVKFYDKSTGKWVIPTVRGTIPKPCKGHLAVLLNGDRILVIKKDSSPDDCIWFLEVDTPYVREQKKMVGDEVVAWSKGVLGNTEKPVVISGPSGVGKGTLISMLKKEFPSMFGFSVSHTTRAPRAKEEDGVHYHFIKRSVMEKEIEDGKFFEFASVHGNLYGTSVEAVEVVANAGKRCILDIDVQGARSVRASSLDAIFIFICPPSMEQLEERLRARKTETEEEILKRLRNAKEEIEQGNSSGIFDHILYNDKLDECYERLKKTLKLDGSRVASHQTRKKARQLPKLLDISDFKYVLNISEYVISTPQRIDLPADHSVPKVDNKIVINCGTAELGKASKNLIVLDISSLKGGAPGRTRGLQVYTDDSFSYV